ncbi:MAG TPA: three-Cys-motif partner protein TcmP [Candidatus Aquilonibacter sp.]|nr:three-Cys-motif partner protein TcmP [Candidatus Aquilonibacter sp.]
MIRIVPAEPRLDQIGYWSELKLDIIREYATAYSTILSARRNPSFHHVYIEGFAGMGVHLSKASKDFVLGSPLNALNVRPPFRGYHLIDIRTEKIEYLRKLIGPREDVFLYRGDCNKILLDEVFPRVKYREYQRALCILDPYGLNLEWKVVFTAGQMEAVDLFLNFPVMGINRNVLRRDPERVEDSRKMKMDALWGDDSWPRTAYGSDLFGNPDKQSNEIIAEAFQTRLREVAGFARVPKPIPMRNSKGAVVYYLFFASQKDTAERIVLDIFKKYEGRGAN